MEMKFAILGNLGSISDLAKISELKIPETVAEERMKNLSGEKGFWISSCFKPFGQAEGYLMTVLLTAQQMMTLPREIVRKRILDAVLFAQGKKDVELLQLGALTKSVTNGGQWITEQKEFKGYINHGDSYTAAVTIEAVEQLVKLRKLDLSQITIGIVGAYGVIGEAVSRVLADWGKLILVGRRMEEFEKLKKELPGQNYEMTTDLLALKEADIVITVTNHPTALLRSEHLKKNAIVIDVAVPPNVSRELVKERPDVLRIDGGLVKDVGVDLGVSIGPPKGTMYACIAEVIMQALEGEKANYVGPVDLNHLEKTKQWAKKWGFELAPFTCYGQPIALNKLKGGDSDDGTSSNPD